MTSVGQVLRNTIGSDAFRLHNCIQIDLRRGMSCTLDQRNCCAGLLPVPAWTYGCRRKSGGTGKKNANNTVQPGEFHVNVSCFSPGAPRDRSRIYSRAKGNANLNWRQLGYSIDVNGLASTTLVQQAWSVVL